MATIRGTSGYNLGSSFPQPSRTHDAMTSDPSPLDQLREQSSKIEDMLNTLAEPVKPYVVLHLGGVWRRRWWQRKMTR